MVDEKGDRESGQERRVQPDDAGKEKVRMICDDCEKVISLKVLSYYGTPIQEYQAACKRSACENCGGNLRPITKEGVKCPNTLYIVRAVKNRDDEIVCEFHVYSTHNGHNPPVFESFIDAEGAEDIIHLVENEDKDMYVSYEDALCRATEIERKREYEEGKRVMTVTDDDHNSYYDLIELPSGRHVPVPIAEKIIGKESLGKIPVSRKVRDNNFFSCPVCGTTDFYANIRYCCVESEEEIEKSEEADEEERELKEKALAMIVRKAQFYKLRYIRAV